MIITGTRYGMSGPAVDEKYFSYLLPCSHSFMNETIAKRTHRLQIRPELVICLFLVLAVLAAYWPVRSHDFINYDDDLYVTDNAHVQAGLTRDSVIWAFTTTSEANWHPLTWLSHMLDYQLYGLDPSGHHLTNVLFHSGNSLVALCCAQSE